MQLFGSFNCVLYIVVQGEISFIRLWNSKVWIKNAKVYLSDVSCTNFEIVFFLLTCIYHSLHLNIIFNSTYTNTISFPYSKRLMFINWYHAQHSKILHKVLQQKLPREVKDWNSLLKMKSSISRNLQGLANPFPHNIGFKTFLYALMLPFINTLLSI